MKRLINECYHRTHERPLLCTVDKPVVYMSRRSHYSYYSKSRYNVRNVDPKLAVNILTPAVSHTMYTVRAVKVSAVFC